MLTNMSEFPTCQKGKSWLLVICTGSDVLEYLFVKVNSIILFLHNSGALINGDYYYFDYMK